ncbi:MAG: CvpA family protein [Caldimicrobium sp.]
MIWFDYLALGFTAYFVIRGFLTGIIKNVFSLVGMIVAFLYSGWLALRLKPFVGHIISHPKVAFFMSYLLGFVLIYLTFVLAGFLFYLLIKSMDMSIGDRILGGLFGFLKGALFTTFLFYLIVIPFPTEKPTLEKAKSYPIVSTTTKILIRLIPQSWLEFIKKSRKYYEIPRTILD